MASKKVNKNLLPLLAFTVLMLSVGLANFSKVSDSKVLSTQSVLSESDERGEDLEDERRVEDERKVEDKTESRRVEDTREEKKRTTSKTRENLSTGKVRVEAVVNRKDDPDAIGMEFKEVDREVEDEENTSNRFNLKIKTETVAGKTIIETAEGDEMKVKDKPEETLEDLVNDGVLDMPTSFEAKTNDKSEVEFEIQGVDNRKLFGFFDISLPKVVTVEAATGKVVSTNQNIWSRLLNFVSK